MIVPGRLPRRCRAVLAIACWMLCAPWIASAEPDPVFFDVPAGDASETLRHFTRQTDLPIIFMVDVVRGVRTQAVRGEFPARDALDRMIGPSELVVVQDPSTGALAISRTPQPKTKRPAPSPAEGPVVNARGLPGAADEPPAMKKSSPLAVLAAWLSAFAAPVSAQQAPSSGEPGSEDKPIVLSPFEVTTDNRGYLATNALSGTRLNTKLEDLASAITVVTKQQLLDTAVSDINDLFLYEANTEGTGNYTAFTPNRDGNVNDDIQADPQVANRVRGLGSANVAVGNFASNPRIPLDLYNIDAVEISRGANSSLFGLGAGSGTVNLVPSAANPGRRFTTVSGRFDDRGGVRGSFDANVPLLKEKLAVRLSAVDENKRFEREPSRDDIRRLQGSVTYKPLTRTTLRASAEFYRREAQRPNSLTPQETITDWLAFGSPAWDPVTQRVRLADGSVSGPFAVNADSRLPLGLISLGGAVYNRTSVQVEPDGTVTYWAVNRTGNQATPLTRNQNVRIVSSGTQLSRERSTLYPLFFDPGANNRSLYDWTAINYVAPNYVEDKADTFSATLEHFFVENDRHLIAGRLGWFRQDFERYNRSMLSNNDSVIYVDVNERRIDGTANPNFGRPYVAGSWPLIVRTPELTDTRTADLVYQFSPGVASGDGRRWIGVQRVNVRGEYRREETTNFRYRDYVVSSHSWINPANRTNSTQQMFVYYLGDSQGGNIDHAPSSRGNLSGVYPFRWYNGPAGQWITEQAELAESAIDGTTTRQRQIRTLSLTYQGYFLNDRIVPTLGLRKDRQRQRNSAGVRVDPATGFITYEPLSDYSNSPWRDQEGETATYGIVVKPASWLRLFYNESDSFDPQGISYNVFEEILPNPTSQGRDFGFGLSLLEGRLSVNVNRYKSVEYNSRRSQIGTVGSRIHRLEGYRQPYNESLFPWAENVVLQRFINQGVNPTADQLFRATAEFVGLTPEFLESSAVSGAVGVPVDLTSEGYEIEVAYNPSPNWRIKINGARQRAVDSNIGDTVTRYLAGRVPFWTTVKDDQGNLWWDANNGAARLRYISDILAPYSFEVANAGKPRSQVREWRWNALTNYDFTSGPLRNWSIGGAIRWEDKAAIGFRGRPPNAEGVILELDPGQPIYDKSRYYVDLNVGYRFRLFDDRVRGRIQLNVRDIFEDGRLQAVAANPDGNPYAFRIIDPRQFILSTSFEF